MLNNIDAVIFDMDGTLIDSMWVWEKVDDDYLMKRNIVVPGDLRKQIEGLGFTETAQYFKNRFSLNDSIKDIMNEWMDMVKYYYQNTIPLKQGVFEFINSLNMKKIKIGLATSNSRELTEMVLKRTNIYHFFNSIVTSCEVCKDKSYPDIYLRTADNMKVKPEKCLVFEDTLSGIIGAKKAGMRAAAVYDEYSVLGRNEIENRADKYIMSFEEIA
jgi:haloacid dehalogenase superfamily, subfamily IA, variant 3 with third motif having DD or ED/haloacid dehalogenase superfamily, subfamily IA, variant 1 with third motif having Dx(3-4)D or Dx(3-4)E